MNDAEQFTAQHAAEYAERSSSGAKTTEQASPFREACNEFEMTLDRLDKIIADLSDRVGLVLLPEPSDVPAALAGVPIRQAALHTDEIRAWDSRVEASLHRLQALTQRVDL